MVIPPKVIQAGVVAGLLLAQEAVNYCANKAKEYTDKYFKDSSNNKYVKEYAGDAAYYGVSALSVLVGCAGGKYAIEHAPDTVKILGLNDANVVKSIACNLEHVQQ